ncbi:MAG: exopolyphosphatase [Bacteroidia bacterium]|nr:exopolyphosphatase [Bacteroidia bacterium]
MRIAVIDLGTNTFNLLIVDKNGDFTYKKLESARIPVKLGEGSINKGFISELPFNRGINALREYRKIIDKNEVKKVLALATSAIRSASNGKDFVAKAKAETGIDIEVIDGLREAELIYFGNRAAVKMDHRNSLIMDIGGGSTEFIIGNNSDLIWKESYLLGAARLLEYIEPSDPITEAEIKSLYGHFDKSLGSLKQSIREHGVYELVGSSGAFDSIVEMMAGEYQTTNITENKTEYLIDLDKYFPLSEKIIRMSYQERLKVKGLIEMRVDMIAISCLFVNYIIREFNLKQLRVSTYSLKEGVIFST